MPIASRKLLTKYELNMTSDKGVLRFHFGRHGNQGTIAMRYVADAYCLKEAPCQIWT